MIAAALSVDQPLGLVYHLTMSTITPRTVNVYDAKTHFSKLLARVEAGERIVIARAGKPVAILGPIDASRGRRMPGRDRGKIVIHPDFDDPLPEFDPDYFHPEDPLRPQPE
jgi:prevent-host-death family protein